MAATQTMSCMEKYSVMMFKTVLFIRYTLKLDDDHRKKMEDLDTRDGLLKRESLQ